MLKKLLLLFALSFASFGLVACGDDDDLGDEMEDVGDELEDTADDAEDELDPDRRH